MGAPEIMLIYVKVLPWLAGFDLVCYVAGALFITRRAIRRNKRT